MLSASCLRHRVFQFTAICLRHHALGCGACPWAAWYNTWLVVKLTLKAVIFSFLWGLSAGDFGVYEWASQAYNQPVIWTVEETYFALTVAIPMVSGLSAGTGL